MKENEVAVSKPIAQISATVDSLPVVEGNEIRLFRRIPYIASRYPVAGNADLAGLTIGKLI